MFEPGLRNALTQFPDVAQQVGCIIAEYGFIELLMFFTCSGISPDPPQDCLTKFYSARSVQNKEKYALEVASANLQPGFQPPYRKLWKRFKGAASRRTEIAHCVFAGGAEVRRLSMLGGKAEFLPLNAAYFKRTIDQFHILGTDVLVFLGLLGQSGANVLRVAQALPRAPILKIPARLLAAQGQLDALEIAELNRSLVRLRVLKPPKS